ncbi:MAG: restriction endonuclease subunit S [Allopontixanthobacter sediminis]
MTAQLEKQLLEAGQWPTQPLADCIQKVAIPAKVPRKQFLEKGDLPIISQEAAFINGFWNDKADAVSVPEPVIVFGDHTQVLKLIDFDFVVGADGVKILKPKPCLDAAFLRYFLEANPFPSLGYARHYRHVSKLKVPLPPLEEQERIVAMLDKAFAALDRARALAETNLADAEELFSSFLENEFSEREKWTRGELGQRVKFIDYRGKTPPKTDSGVRLITAKNVRMGFIKPDPIEFILEEAYDAWMTRGFPAIGDVLFTTEAPLAYVAQLDTDEKVVIGQRLITFKTDSNEIAPSFLKWSLISPQMQSEIHSQATGATVLGIKAKLLKKIALFVPQDIEVQEAVALKCEEAFRMSNELAVAYRAKLADLDTLRQSILQRAFAGELT